MYAEPSAEPSVLDAARAAGVDVVPVTAGSLAKVTEPVTPQSVAALAAIPSAPRDGAGGLVVLMVDVGDPGNVGTLVRVAEAAGAAAVWNTGTGADVWSPKCVRASAGSCFRLPIVDEVDPAAAIAALRGDGLRIVATALATPEGTFGSAPETLDLRGSVAVVLGSEAHGLPDDLVASADDVVRIPMAGRVESLNVAMAGAVVAFEAARQRRASNG